MTRSFALFLSLAVLGFGATVREPENCASRPCTYTITCADTRCSAEEVKEFQQALGDAYRGDTIKLQAGRVFPSDKSFWVTRRPGSDGYLTITTTTDPGRLPDENTRITRAYAALLPTLEATTGGFALGLAGNDVPAEYVRLVGLRFTVAANHVGYGPLLIGNPGLEFGLAEVGVTSPNQQPDYVIVDRCLFDQDFTREVSHMITVNSRNAIIKNSFIDGIRALDRDTQAIWAFHGPGPLTVENCYIGGATENIMYGAAGPRYDEGSATSGALRFNYLPHDEERMRFSAWRPGMVVFKGRVIRPSRGTGVTYRALTTGVTGNVEPAWPGTIGSRTEDNGISWVAIATGNSHLAVKNNFEIKSVRDLTVQHNVFDKTWADGQTTNIVIKLSNCLKNGSSTCVCVPEYSGFVKVSGVTVESADGLPLPNLHKPTENYNIDPLVIYINEVPYRVAAFVDDNKLTLTTSPGDTPRASYRFGQPGCRAAWDKDVRFMNNWVRSGPNAIGIIQWGNGVRSRIGNIQVKDNLFEDMDCEKWSSHRGSCEESETYVFLAHLPTGVELNHNTILGRNAPVSGIHFEGAGNQHAGDGKILNNILPRGAQVGIRGGGRAEGSPTLDSVLCAGVPCPRTQYDKNIVAGADRRVYVTGDTYNLCPGPGRCPINWDFEDPNGGKLFENFSRGVYRVREGHWAKRGASDGKDIGADVDQLPQIRNLKVEATDRMALFSYELTQPIQHIPCVVEVSAERDLSRMVPDLDPAVYIRPDSDRQTDSIVTESRRTIRVGKNVPLAASAVYWYRLQCGGDARYGGFTTKDASTTSPSLSMSHVPVTPGVAGFVVEYGTSYDRASDTITGIKGTASVTCAAGASCQVTITGEPGQMVYYRIIEQNQSGGEISRSTVWAAADPSTVGVPLPRLESAGVTNAASYENTAVAPCEIITIFGRDIGPPEPVLMQMTPDGTRLVDTLANTRVLFDRQAAPLLFVSQYQVSAVVPSGTANKPLTEVQVEHRGLLSDPIVLPTAPVTPGIYTANARGFGQGAILNQDYSVNGPLNAAPHGSVVMIYGTSGGLTNPACADGKIVTELKPLQFPISATVGGVPATVLYAGSAPGLLDGVLQVNLQVPGAAPVGEAVPVVITIGSSQTQQGVTLAVRAAQ